MCSSFTRGCVTIPMMGKIGSTGRHFTNTLSACAVRTVVRSKGTLRDNASRFLKRGFTGTFSIRFIGGRGGVRCI